jgi:hypothetical protein
MRITFKTPDALYDALQQELVKQLGQQPDPDEWAELHAKIHEKASKWIKWGEYLTVNINTETGEATVVPVT